MTSALTAALRAGAAGLYPDEAGTGLLTATAASSTATTPPASSAPEPASATAPP
jgi:hypothetical protein